MQEAMLQHSGHGFTKLCSPVRYSEALTKRVEKDFYLEFMKKILISLCAILFLSGCFIFKKKEKYGCPSDGRNVGAEKIVAGDQKSIKASKKAKFRGG